MADKIPLGVLKPHKPVSQMNVEERAAFVRSISDMIRGRHAAAQTVLDETSSLPSPAGGNLDSAG